MKRKIFFLIGEPLSGRRTFIKQAQEELGERVDVIRTNILLEKANKPRGVGNTYDEARFVTTLIKQKLVSCDAPNVIIYGYPRDIEQAKIMLNPKTFPGCMKMLMCFEIPHGIAYQRALERMICQNCRTPYAKIGDERPVVDGICDECGGTLITRNDDSVALIQQRWDYYHEYTAEAVKYLRHMGVPIIYRRYDDGINNVLDNFN